MPSAFRSSPSSRRLATAIAGAAATLLIAGAATAPGAGAGSNDRLLPDLVTLRVSKADLRLQRNGRKLVLRLTNEIGNKGRGPLEIYPGPTPNDCDGDGNPANDRDAHQRIFRDSNGDNLFDRAQDTESSHHRFGCKRYHSPHDHWHLLNFSRYKLVRSRSGRTVVRSTKISFCVVDTNHPFRSLPGSAATAYYPAGSSNCQRDSIDGISVGWSDTYGYFLPGQQLNVTGLRRGRYCLVSTADPASLLRESDNSNNARRTLIALRPAKRRVKRLPGPCSRHW